MCIFYIPNSACDNEYPLGDSKDLFVCLSIDQSNIVNLLLWYKNVCPRPLTVSLFTNFSVHVWLTGRVLFLSVIISVIVLHFYYQLR